MSGKFYSLIIFLIIYWFLCLYIGFKNQKKIISPVDFFLFGRQLPSWSYYAMITGSIFSLWMFFVQPSFIFVNGLPFALTSLCVIVIPMIGTVFSKKQWMLSKRYGFVTPPEMISAYFKSDIIRILIVVITLGFSIPFIAMQLSIGGVLINVISDGVIGPGSAAILIGSVIAIYLSAGGMKSLTYIDSMQFLLVIFGIICLGFVTLDLVGGWSLLNESLSRIGNIKANLFNSNENYGAYLSVPGTIKNVEIQSQEISYNGIWTTSMVLSFIFGLAGIKMSPNISMLTFASKEIKYFSTQQIWFSGFLIGSLLIFSIATIGVGSVLLGGNNIVNESGNNISNILPPNMYPNEYNALVPHLINLIGEYSIIFFGLLAVCAIASIQSIGSIYLTTSAILTRDIIKRFFVKNLNTYEQIFTSRILLMLVFIISLILSILAGKNIIDLGSFALSVGCQMLVPLIAICYFPWFTKQGVSLGIIVGIIAVIFTESIGQEMFGSFVGWNKWPLTIHSSIWGVLFNLIATSLISFITQEIKETNHKNKYHEFINESKNYSLSRRTLKPSAWIMVITWIFFGIGPGLIMGNQLFGNPVNVESWSFGMPSIWVWKIIFWVLGILLTWFLAIKMEMSTSLDKAIVPQTEDSGGSFKG